MKRNSKDGDQKLWSFFFENHKKSWKNPKIEKLKNFQHWKSSQLIIFLRRNSNSFQIFLNNQNTICAFFQNFPQRIIILWRRRGWRPAKSCFYRFCYRLWTAVTFSSEIRSERRSARWKALVLKRSFPGLLFSNSFCARRYSHLKLIQFH